MVRCMRESPSFTRILDALRALARLATAAAAADGGADLLPTRPPAGGHLAHVRDACSTSS